MSGTAYPSQDPTASPTIDDPDTLATTDLDERERIETQRSLHHASAALEAAYHRIRQVRRNLLELTDTLPLSNSQTRTTGLNSIGPGHEAITLTGTLLDNPLNQVAGSHDTTHDDTSTPNRLRQYEMRLAELDIINPAAPPVPSQPQVRIRDSASLNVSSSPSQNRPHIFARRSQLESQISRRREAYSDDAATTLGRRVAAREAAGSTFPNAAASFRLAAMERDIEHFRAATRQRRTEPQRPEGFAESTRPTATETRPSRSLDAIARALQFQVLRLDRGLPPDHPNPRRRFGGGSLHAPQSPASYQSERLSLLSNFSAQNLSTPTTGNSRPLLFDEPSSYIQAANFAESTPSPGDEPHGGHHEDRIYALRRRINADGEEHVHPISFEWSDEESSWLLPRGLQEGSYFDYVLPSRNQSNRYLHRSDTVQTQAPSRPPPPPSRQRRRGWARLDADGNEIPSDEEEELERLRAEYRVQAQSRPRAPAVQNPSFDTRLHFPVINTPDDDPGFDSHPRVRLNPRESRTAYGSVVDSVMMVHGGPPLSGHMSPQHIPSSTPFYPNPLPMQLDEMVAYPRKKKRNECPRSIGLPKDASLAGR